MKRKYGISETKYLAIGGLIISAVLVLIGVLEGQHRDVLQKAIKICLECVGIG